MESLNITNTNSDISFDHVDLQPDEVEMVIYHGECTDGFTSAYCAFEYFSKKEGEKRDILYYPGAFNKSPPLKKAVGKCVLICDFSYKKVELMKLASVVKKLLILDHHKTAEADLKDLPDNQKVFRMDHSGAYITYKYFNRNEQIPMPMMITYVEDNDIWLKKQPLTQEFTAYIFSLPFKFEEYGKLMNDEYVKTIVFTQGSGMVKQNNSNYYIKQ